MPLPASAIGDGASIGGWGWRSCGWEPLWAPCTTHSPPRSRGSCTKSHLVLGAFAKPVRVGNDEAGEISVASPCHWPNPFPVSWPRTWNADPQGMLGVANAARTVRSPRARTDREQSPSGKGSDLGERSAAPRICSTHSLTPAAHLQGKADLGAQVGTVLTALCV